LTKYCLSAKIRHSILQTLKQNAAMTRLARGPLSDLLDLSTTTTVTKVGVHLPRKNS